MSGPLPFIVVEDPVVHPPFTGPVVSGSQYAFIRGKQVARAGGPVVCGTRGSGEIVTGDPTDIIDGKPVKHDRDRVLRGGDLRLRQPQPACVQRFAGT